MKYFLVLLAVAAVFAQDTIDTSIEDKLQEVDNSIEDLDLETLTNEDVDSNQQAVVPASTNLCSINVPALTALINGVINKRLASQPGMSKTYIYMIVHLFTYSCADALSYCY